MNGRLFEELLKSVREGGAILRGRRKPSRAFDLEELDVKAVRKDHRPSQSTRAERIERSR